MENPEKAKNDNRKAAAKYRMENPKKPIFVSCHIKNLKTNVVQFTNNIIEKMQHKLITIKNCNEDDNVDTTVQWKLTIGLILES